MRLGGIISFLIFEEIEEIIKQQGIGIEKKIVKYVLFNFLCLKWNKQFCQSQLMYFSLVLSLFCKQQSEQFVSAI